MDDHNNVDHGVITGGGYLPPTRWRPLAAGLAALGIVATSYVGVPWLMYVVLAPQPLVLVGAEDFISWGPLLASQGLITLAVVWLAGWYHGNRRQVLALGAPYPSGTFLATRFSTIMLVSLAYTMALFQWRPEIVEGDLAPFLPLVRSEVWYIYGLIIIVGAAVSEELLFRGFLLPALAKTPLGIVGASLITTTAWAALHMQYSVFALAEIFAIGLFFSWLLWSTGSLWTTIILHALYNGTQFVGMRFGLFPWTRLMAWITG